MTERYAAIIDAHLEALGERDPRGVMPAELFPAVSAAVSDVTHEEILAALNWKADRCIEEAKSILHGGVDSE